MLKIKLIFDSSIRVVPRSVAENPSFGLPDIIAYAIKRFNLPAEDANMLLLTANDDAGNRLAVSTPEDLAAALAHAASRGDRSLKLNVGFQDEEDSSALSSESSSGSSSESEGESDADGEGKDENQQDPGFSHGHYHPGRRHRHHHHHGRRHGHHQHHQDQDQVGENGQEPVWVKHRRAARERKQKDGNGDVAVGCASSNSKNKKNKANKSPGKGRKNAAAVDKLKSRLALKKDKIRALRTMLKEERAKNRQLASELRKRDKSDASAAAVAVPAQAIQGFGEPNLDVEGDRHKHRHFGGRGRRHGRHHHHHKHFHSHRMHSAGPPAFAASMQIDA
eukprot:GABV01008663.1.p2 GENE.GABV01008663.1~~GABV01008663.1.p2  ORF type:complete len:335 (+),score=143.79 GABV01008663.1:104-1108(+)